MGRDVPLKGLDDLAVDGVYMIESDLDIDIREAIKYCKDNDIEPMPQFVVDMFDRNKGKG